METLKQQLSNVLKYGAVLVTIGLISLLFPKTAGFQFSFHEGQVWPYDDLVAPMDFPIQKTDQQLRKDRQEITGHYIPYYIKNENVSSSIKFEFVKGIEGLVTSPSSNYDDLKKRTLAYKKKGIEIIDYLTDKGMYAELSVSQDTSKSSVVNLIVGSNVEPVGRASFLSLEEARTYISRMLSDWNAPDADLILPIITDALQPNISYDVKRTSDYLQEQLNAISVTQGVVKSGELIVRNNGYISQPVYQKLLSYKNTYEEFTSTDKTTYYVYLGYLLLTSLVILAFVLFLQFNAPEVYEKFSSVLFMLMLILVYSYIVNVIEGMDDLSTYMIPFCIIPILAITFFSDRIAFFLHIIVILLASFLSDLGYEFTFLQIFAGIVTILTFKTTRYWGAFFRAVAMILTASLLAFLGLNLLKEGSLSSIDWESFMWIFVSAFLTLLAFPLIPLIERIFGFTSSISLSELADLNRPLLKRLSNQAPGTFQHSLQVSNLAEAAAEEVNAGALLVKVAALYHDIGKLKNPEYFIENQSGYNPHDELNELESAKIIIEHVAEGVRMAKQTGLPSILIEFIQTHHGTTRVEYFYHNYKKNFPDQEIDLKNFTYPGPKPTTKEECILMMADSLEASSKSLRSPTGQDIDNLVDSIIDGKIKSKQLSNSRLTFEDLEICKKVFKRMLRSIHHVRIEYPEPIADKENSQK